MKTKKPVTLGASLSTLLKNIGIDEKVNEYQAIVNWPELVGDNVSTATHALNVIDGILFVKVVNSSWRNELIFLKSKILKKLDKRIGSGVIKDIRFI